MRRFEPLLRKYLILRVDFLRVDQLGRYFALVLLHIRVCLETNIFLRNILMCIFFNKQEILIISV